MRLVEGQVANDMPARPLSCGIKRERQPQQRIITIATKHITTAR